MTIKNKPLFALSILLFLSLLIILVNDWQRPFFPGNEGLEIILVTFLILCFVLLYLSIDHEKTKNTPHVTTPIYLSILIGILFWQIIRWNSNQELETHHKIVKGVVTNNFLTKGKGSPIKMIEYRFEVAGVMVYKKYQNLPEPLLAGDSIFVKYSIKDPLINEFWPLQE